MTREVNRVTKVVLAAFAVIALSSLFWTVFQADSMVARPDNARNVIDEQRIRRGAIYDQDGARLAYSEANEAGLMERVYPEPAAVGAVGYYSFQYGVAGIEAYHPAAKLGQCRILERMGRQRGFLITAGSDFHGPKKPECGIGRSAGGLPIDDSYYGELVSFLSGSGA